MTPEKKTRYDVSDLAEAQTEPGSCGKVLKNLLGIKTIREMDRVEARELIRTQEELVRVYDQNHRFTSDDVCRIHRIWLGPVYEWAGKYRQVNISKSSFPFAAAVQIQKLMGEFENDFLRKYTPCQFSSSEKTAEAVAIVHVELLLIHPFREGNGRVARLLAILMGLQAGLPPLDFSSIYGQKRQEYVVAVQKGLERDYKPMVEIFNALI